MKNNFSVVAIKKESVLMLGLLICIAVAAPILFKQQFISGTIVNASLIVGVYLLGSRDGLLISIIPSSFALATGLLPAALAPMIPFIIIGNAILVLTFNYLQKFNIWAGFIIGSVLKFIFLYATSTVVIGLLINSQIAPVVAQMMSWPQLVTALCGGIVACGIIKVTRNWNLKTRI